MFCFKNTIQKRTGVICVDYSRCDECQPFIDDDAGNRRIPMRMRQDFMRLAMDAADAFVSPSQYLADIYLKAGFSPDKMHVLWNGIDIDKFTAIVRKPLQGKLRFSFFGYFGLHKGVSTLLEALPLLKNPKNVQVNLIGDGDQRAAYEQRLSENGCTDRVKFWGKLDNNDVARAYAETDVLVLPSIWCENQPVSITEAMACGMPVIGSNMGGIPELVENGVNGFIFEAGNAIDLADKMDRLMANSALVTAMGLNGQKKIRSNTFALQVEKLLPFYCDKSDLRLSATDHVPVIACIGHQVDDECAAAMSQLTHFWGGTQPYMLMADWLTESQLQQASLVWVVDATTSSEVVARLASRGLPLLVPEKNSNLLVICQKYHCGLYYRDGDEATACMAHMLIYKQDRKALGRNASTASFVGYGN
jgi:Glycosyl transferases group 1